MEHNQSVKRINEFFFIKKKRKPKKKREKMNDNNNVIRSARHLLKQTPPHTRNHDGNLNFWKAPLHAMLPPKKEEKMKN